MVSDKKNRYLYKCSCQELRKRPFVLQILTIMKQSEKKLITKGEINKIGQQKHQDWPKDSNTTYRALKTMRKCNLISETQRGKGQSTIWSLNKKQTIDRELILHEIKQMEQAVSHLPHWTFENKNFKEEIDKIWQKIRTALIDLQKQDITANWALFHLKEEKLLTSKEFTILDKQLSVIFIFCLLLPGWELLSKWFDVTQIPFRVKADLKLNKIFMRNFYPINTSEKIFEKLDKHELKPDLCKKLQFLMYLRFYTSKLDDTYTFELFDKNKFPSFTDDEIEEYKDAITAEKVMLFTQRVHRKNPLLSSMEKRGYAIDHIDLFIEEYKEYLDPIDVETSSNVE